MAVIGKIRQRSGLLVVVVGIALAAFVLGDFAKRSKPQTPNIGVINGENINYQDYNRKFEENLANTRQQRQTDRLSQDEIYRARESTWTQMVQQLLMEKEYDKLGLSLTPDELFDQIQGADPHPAVIQSFTDPETGEFNRELVINYLHNLDNMQQAAKDQWLNFERYVKEDRLRTKYQNLIAKSYHMPAEIAKLSYQEKNDAVDLEFTAVRYSNIADSLVTLSDADYKAFYDTYKNNYDREAERDIEYIIFEVVPSDEDIENSKSYIEGLIPEFIRTTNVESFVNANSESSYDGRWLGHDELSPALAEVMFEDEQEIGFVYGPYFEDDAYKIARLVNKADRVDSLMASHILIAYEGALRSEQSRSVEEARSLADSLLTVVKKRPAALEELAGEWSDDASAEMNQGDLGWFTDGQMVPTFNDFVVDNPVGAVDVVESDFGFHIIKVTGKKEPSKKVQLAVISQEVSPSSKTHQDIFAQASKFAAENKTMEQFNATIENEGLNKRLAPSLRAMSNRIPGLENPRQVVRWAFDEKTKPGEVSTIFDLDDMFVIAVLTKKTEKGIPVLADLKEQIESQVRNKKKGEMLLQKMKEMNNDLQKIAEEYNVQVEELDGFNFDTRMFAGYGQENKIIGEVFGMKEGEVKTIAGNNAAFAVKLKSAKKSDDGDASDLIHEQLISFQNTVRNNAAYRAIEKISKIEDNRLMFY